MNANSYRNYYDWLAPKLSSEERRALDVIYEAANRSSGPNCKAVQRYACATAYPSDDRKPYGMLVPDEHGDWVRYSDVSNATVEKS